MLSGIKILEIEGLGPAPFAGMHLADLGAEVIVVNRPGGQKTPGLPQQQILDRGKRSIELDLKNPNDIKVVKALAAESDALIEGFRPGVMERLGLGPEILNTVNPALVYGRMTGWGQTGPMSKQAGHDLNYISVSGAAWYASDAGSPPFTPPTLVGDIGGGALYLVIGIISGVLNAHTTGKGCVVDAAIYDGSAHMMNLLMTLRQSGGFVDKRNASVLDGSHWSRAYLTSDGGYMSVQCLEPKFYAEFLSCLGQSDNPALADQYDQAQWPEQTRIISDIFKSRTRSEWEQVFEGTNACTAPVLSPEQASKHPMNDARQVWLTEGDTLQAASAPRFSGTPVKAAPSIPERGEHTIEILAELGM